MKETTAKINKTKSQFFEKINKIGKTLARLVKTTVIPFSCLQSFPASGSFPMSQIFASGGQSIGVSASTSVCPMNIQD